MTGALQYHDFKERRAFSESARNEAFWEEVYRKAFPEMLSMHLNARNNGAQRCGVDRVIVLSSTRVITCDEKVRERDWGDMLIEVYHQHSGGRKTPGWIYKDLTCDYLSYGVLPARTAYLFPWDLLRAAWRTHGGDWKRRARAGEKGFFRKEAKNNGYVTVSCIVPLPVVREAVCDALEIHVEVGT